MYSVHGWVRSHRAWWQRDTKGTNFSGRVYSHEPVLSPKMSRLLPWHNLFHSHSLYYVVASDIPGQDSHLAFEARNSHCMVLFISCMQTVHYSPKNFIYLHPLFLFVSQCCSYFFTNDKGTLLVMEYHRDFCQLSPPIEIIILSGQRIFYCGTGSNNIKRCYLFSSLSLQQMGATFKAMQGFKM